MTLRLAKDKRRQAQQAGFSMLEAVIAIGILAATLLPLLDFQISVADGARRLEGHQKNLEMEARALAYLRSLPPASLASGKADLGGLQLTWSEKQSSVSRRMISEQGAPGRFEIEVIRLEYTVAGADAQQVQGHVDRLNWRAVTPFFDQ